MAATLYSFPGGKKPGAPKEPTALDRVQQKVRRLEAVEPYHLDFIETMVDRLLSRHENGREGA
jgi:hypothetical protein